MFSVGDSISNNNMEEQFQDTTGLFVDEARATVDL